MQVPSILQGDSLTRLLQGAAAGAVATMFVGFYWGGWSVSSTADKMAKERSELAVVAALAPVCADKFRALPDADAKKVSLSKVDSWKRGDEFPKEFVTLPGQSYPSSALVDACSTLLLTPKSAELKRGSRINAAATGRTQIGSFETPKVSPTKRAAAHAPSRRQPRSWQRSPTYKTAIVRGRTRVERTKQRLTKSGSVVDEGDIS